tara:strand:+ start:368 stop:589 length:222 start_codon:yes stop_codon:yes gene_type:complete
MAEKNNSYRFIAANYDDVSDDHLDELAQAHFLYAQKHGHFEGESWLAFRQRVMTAKPAVVAETFNDYIERAVL